MRHGVVLFVLGAGWLLGALPGRVQAQEAPREAVQQARAADVVAWRDTLDAQRIQPFVLRPFVLAGTERVWLDGAALDTARYRIDYRHGRLWLPHVPQEAVRLVVRYRTFPFQFEDVYRRRAAARSDSAGPSVVVEEEGAEAAYDPFAGLTLERSGSISRGLIAGSGRDLGIESGLRMQLSGRLAEDVHVRAALTDQNTPIQPEGATRRLRDVDRVFVEIEAPYGTAQLGDVDLTFERSAFARLDRTLQGATVHTEAQGGGGWWQGGTVTAAGAVARGTYRTQQIEPVAGVQGPYRLRGEGGEPFVIVVAGSERVYLDGERLTRGETNDYVIDYATGEITFTANRLITSERRIRVEFEYAATPYTRAFTAVQGQAAFGRTDEGAPRATVGAAFIREADSRRLDAALPLSRRDSLALVRAGEGPALRSGAERVPFDAEAPYVQYAREVRRLPGGRADTAFVALRAAPPEGAPVYRVRFSHVGAGRGRYVRGERALNGVVYAYRGPGRGAYEPAVPLPRPRRQRLVDLHGRIEVAPGLELFGEWARSVNDQNRLSALDAANDGGRAYLAGVRLHPTALDLGPLPLRSVAAAYERQVRSAHFATFGRTRPVEFERRWNLDAPSSLGMPSAAPDFTAADMLARPSGAEVIDEAELRIGLAENAYVQGEAARLSLGRQFESRRRALTLVSEAAALPHVRAERTFITSTDRRHVDGRHEGGRWLRQRASIRQPLWGGRLVPRLEVEQERRRQHVLGADSLARGSFAFVEYRPGVAYERGNLRLGAEVEWRSEKEAARGRLRPSAQAWTLLSDIAYSASSTFDTEARVGLRRREFTEYFRVEEGRSGRASVVLQSQTQYRPLQRAVEVEGFYEALTERAPTLQEVYVPVGPEHGQYVWEDLNGDGLVQVDEFLPERTPNEGTYVQTYVPSDSLVGVISVEARLRLRLDPRRLWAAAEARWKRWLAHVQAQTLVAIREQSRADDLAQVYLLHPRLLRNPATTQSGQLRLAQDVALFRTHPRYGLDLSYSRVLGLENRAAGAEQRAASTWRVEGRVQPAARWTLEVAGQRRTNRSTTRFASRTYAIRSLEAGPRATYRTPDGTWRVTGGATLASKRDAVAARRARLLRVPVEVQYARAGRLHLTARADAAHVALDGGAAAGLARFELTDGRGPGTSLRWGLSGQYALSSTLRATLAYDGFAPAGAPAVNTLRMSLSATF